MGKRYNSRRVIKRYGKCVYCESTQNLTADHVVPVSRYKTFNLTFLEVHADGNLVAACRGCNSRKDNLGLEKFLSENPNFAINFTRNARYVSDRILEALRVYS